jgi:signal transduction histidine kinase
MIAFPIALILLSAVGSCLWRAPGALRERIGQRWRTLVLLGVALLWLGLSWSSFSFVLVAIAVILMVAAPGRAGRLAPFAMLGYGLVGVAQSDYPGLVGWDEFYGGYRFYRLYSDTHPLLPLGLAFCAAGIALIWWSPTTESRVLRTAAGQLRGAGRVPGWLLFPAGLLWVGAVSMPTRPHFTVLAIVLGVCVVTVLRFTRVAAVMAVFALTVYGIFGVLLPMFWPAVLFTQQNSNLYGVTTLGTSGRAVVACAQGLALLGAIGGLRLWPRLLVDSPERELAERANWLSQRVQRLSQTRSDASEAAIAELKRIERDLHDGAQARLVALGMSLRAAERLMPVSPEAALALVTEARETSSRALTDLRDLVRGIYPPVLADRGLADALRSLALDAPMQVDVDIDLPNRVPMPIAAAVYFAAAEVLANAARHSEAEHVAIIGQRVGPALRVEISDDGIGGADPSCGTGLAGVERRLGTFDGILAVSSPIGGPTIVAIEVPCA